MQEVTGSTPVFSTKANGENCSLFVCPNGVWLNPARITRFTEPTPLITHLCALRPLGLVSASTLHPLLCSDMASPSLQSRGAGPNRLRRLMQILLESASIRNHSKSEQFTNGIWLH